jgi:hypothetical protein
MSHLVSERRCEAVEAVSGAHERVEDADPVQVRVGRVLDANGHVSFSREPLRSEEVTLVHVQHVGALFSQLDLVG